MASVWINETDIGAKFGFYPEQMPSWTSAPARSYQVSAIPGRMGGVLGQDPTYPYRPQRIIGSVDPPARTVAARESAEVGLKALAYRGDVVITVDDDINPPRRIRGVCTSCTFTNKGHPFTATVSQCEMEFLCPDPTWYALQSEIVAFGSTPVPIPLGNAVSGGIIRLAAPSWSADVTDPTVTYYAASRASVESLAFSGITLTAGLDYLEIDLDRATVVEYASGVATSRIDKLAGNSDFFSLDPTDGDYAYSSFPYISATATGGTLSGQLLYARRWM